MPPEAAPFVVLWLNSREDARLIDMSQFLRKPILIILVHVVAVGIAFSQAAPAANTQSEVNRSQAAPSAGQPASASASSAVAQPAYLTPIGGFQGVLAETVEGSTIAAQAADEKFNPASAVKLATALTALQAFGPDHRFMTALWSTGAVDKSTGTLNGDLVVTGRDPSFHYEHAVMLARQLNELGIRNVTGNLIVAPGFTMNFDWSTQRSGEDFLDTLDSAKRSASATRVWLDDRTLVGDSTSLSSVPSVAISGDVLVGSAPVGAVDAASARGPFSSSCAFGSADDRFRPPPHDVIATEAMTAMASSRRRIPRL